MVTYKFGFGLYEIKNTRTKRNAMIPISYLTLGETGSVILGSTQKYTRCQLLRRVLEDSPGIIKPVLGNTDDISKIRVSEIPTSWNSSSALSNSSKASQDLVFPALENMIIEVVDEGMVHTRFVMSTNLKWNLRILDYAIQPYLFQNINHDADIEPINDSLGYLLKVIWNWDNEKINVFYDKKKYEPALYSIASDTHRKYIDLMSKLKELTMVECPDASKKELNDIVRKRIAIFTSALYPNVDPSNILLLGTEYGSTETAIKYIHLQYKKYLMVASEFLKDPQGGLTTAPLYEINQYENELEISSLMNHTTVVYPEEIGYNNGLINPSHRTYPESMEITNIQLLLDQEVKIMTDVMKRAAISIGKVLWACALWGIVSALCKHYHK